MRRWLGLTMLMLAGAAPAAAAPPATEAKVEAHSVIHPGEKLAVHVPAAAAYVGSDRFTLYGVADCEVHVFAEADDQRRLKRLYWIQFEGYLPSRPELSYDYAEGNRRTETWGTTTWLRAGPVATDSPTREGSDREHVVALLTRAGYTIPPEVMNVRLVQMLDDPRGTGQGRRELMLIYSEDLALAGKTLAELTTDGEPDARWAPLEAGLVERATTAFRVERR